MATMKVLVVGGGGGGGAQYSQQGGGGGAGGYQYNSSFDVPVGSYSVTVGAGGSGGINSSATQPTNGGNSIFSTITAYGGGKGGMDGAGGNGGCGGGSATLNINGGTGSQGGNGGYGQNGGSAGGGGGAGGNGGTGSAGPGLANSITGTSVTYAAGGDDNSGGIGAANTGNGGQGSRSGNGYAGGSGIVIISYLTSLGLNLSYTGSYETGTSGSETWFKMTTSGTLTITSLPTVTTQAVTDIDLETATGNGNVTSDGGATITERGVCWNTSGTPTTSDSKATASGTTGAFTASMTGLDNETLYYVRAYATNSNGTSYGNEVSFTTLSLSIFDLVKDISGIQNATYAVQLKTNITTGTLTVKLGTTGYSEVISTTGALTTTLQGTYSGLSGLIITQSEDFVGTLDDVFWVLVVGDETIDWDIDTLTNLYPINSYVKFKRVEDKEITRFNIYRYIDTLFKDLDAYVTITLTEEANDLSSDRSKVFVVGNTSGDITSPFVKKRISILSKNQAILLQFSNNNLNETFTICEYSLTGFKEPRKLYKLSNIISF